MAAAAVADTPALPVALVVLDMQAAFLKVIAEAEPLLQRVALAISAARLLDIEVIFTEQVPHKLGGTDEQLLARAPGAAVFAKTAFSALGAKGLVEHLRLRGVDHLLIAGIETPICVYQTASQALHADFDVTLLSDAVGARRPADAAVALDALRAAGAHVLPAETVFYSILQDAADPRLRAFTQLIKSAS